MSRAAARRNDATPNRWLVPLAAVLVAATVLALPIAYFREMARSLVWAVRQHHTAAWQGVPVRVPGYWYQRSPAGRSLNLHRARWSGRSTREDMSVRTASPTLGGAAGLEDRAARLAILLNGPGALTYKPTLPAAAQGRLECAAFPRRPDLRSVYCEDRAGKVSGELTTTRMHETADLADFAQVLLECAAAVGSQPDAEPAVPPQTQPGAL